MRFLLVLCLAVSVSGADFGAKMKPFADKYCFSCHGPKKQKSNLRLDTLPTVLKDLKVAEEWQHVLDELNGATMPPEDERQPTADELSDILEVLTFNIEEAKKKLYGKDRETVMRRLNRREYVNTVYDLTGVKVEEHQLPEDGRSANFDTNGKGLYMSSYQFDRYMDLGKMVLDEAIVTGKKPKFLSKTVEIEIERNKSMSKQLKRNQSKAKSNDPRADRYKQDVKALQTYLNNGLIKKFALTSEYFNGGPSSKKHFQSLEFRLFGKKEFSPGTYKLTVHVAKGDTKPGDRVMIEVGTNFKDRTQNRLQSVYEVNADLNKPQKIELEVTLKVDSGFKIIPRISRTGKHVPFAAIDKVKIEGPIIGRWPPASHRKVFPVEQGEMPENEYASKVIKSFALKAFRYRRPTEKFLSTMLEVFKFNRAKKMSVQDALKEPLAVILSSPNFLYMVEEDAKAVRAKELASRLSYFLWSTRPDNTLYRLAASGELLKPEVIKSQVKRMLKDEKALTLAKGFVPQWLDFHKLDEVDVNTKKFSKYDAHVKRDVKLESIHFFNTIASRNMSLENFIDSNFAVVNNVMREYYGLPSGGKDEFAPVKLPEKSGRGGLLGQASVLIMTGNGERTSPVMRGAFIMSKMMGMSSPEPPPNVPQLDNEKTKGLSIRDALHVHQAQPQCSSCHKRIDPAGFGLENFDAAGIWREESKPAPTAKKSKKKGKSKGRVVVDNDGHLPGGLKFTNIFELKKLLMDQKDNFAKSIIEELMGYAFGRDIGFADAKLVDQLLAKAKKNSYRFGDLIAEIAASPEFMMK